MLSERFQTEPYFLRHDLGDDPFFCRAECKPQAGVRLRRVNQRVEEYLAVPFGKLKGLVPRNRGSCRFGQRCQTKVRQAPALHCRRFFHELSSLQVHTETKTPTACTPLFRVCQSRSSRRNALGAQFNHYKCASMGTTFPLPLFISSAVYSIRI